MVEWAEKELSMINKEDDPMQRQMNEHIMTIVRAFCDEGHSGFSASYALGIIKRLLAWRPILPLTGEESEWRPVQEWDKDDNSQQNMRCTAVFRKNFDNSTAYYIDGKVFSDDGGKTWWTNRDSFVPVTFPYHVPESPERVILLEGESL